MSLQPMPVLDRLLATRHAMPEDLSHGVDMAWGAVKVRADSAADMYWQTPKEVWSGSDFPPIRLPFPTMWIEWDQPRKWITDGGEEIVGVTPVEFGSYRGVLVNQASPSALERIRETTSGAVVAPARAVESFILNCYSMREGKVGYFPFIGIVHVDEDGRSIGEVGWFGPTEIDGGRNTVDLLHSQFGKLILLAIGLMNCKNVSLTERVSKVPIGRRQRRRNGGIKYHTIDVPGHQVGVRRGSGASSAHALHRVRGHFKTFTSDAPLMGKHVGTYWWGWQLRGSKSNGINVTDYKIGATS